VSREDPHQFYLRAREDFIKSPGLNEAANLYFAVENLHAHGIPFHTPDSVRKAYLLLKNEDVIEEDDGSESGSYGGFKGQTEQEKRDLRRLARENADRRKGKTGTKFRRMDTPSNYPDLPPAFDPSTSDLPLSDFFRHHNKDLRTLWEFMAVNERVVPEQMVDAFYSYRPTGDHPLSSIFDSGLDGQSKWHSLLDRLYTPTSSDNAATLDSKMKRYEEKFGSALDSNEISTERSHQEMFGKFDDNSVGLHDLFLGGLGTWQAGHKMNYGQEGDTESYLAHLKMKMEGVPQSIISQTLFNEDGSLRKDHATRAKTAIRNSADSQQQMGLLPLLLGLENLSTADGKTAIKWFMDGAQGNIQNNPTSRSETNFLNGRKDPESLLSRIWKKRLSAISAGLTTPLIQAGIQQSPTRATDMSGSYGGKNYRGFKRDPSSREADLWHKALVWCRADKDGVHKLHREENPPVFHQMMNEFGILPNGKGHYSGSHPKINEKLIDDWLMNGVKGITREQVAKLKEWKEKVEKYSSKDWTKTAWGAPYHAPTHPDGKDSFSKVYHDIFASGEGGHSMSPADLMQAMHQMFGGMFTMRPHYEASDLQGSNKKTVRQVIYDDDGVDTRRGGDADFGGWAAATDMIGESGMVPYAGRGESKEGEPLGMDYNSWLGMLLPKDRDIISNLEGSGSPLYSTNSMYDFAALPKLPFSLRDYHKQRRSADPPQRSGDRIGDGLHLSSDDARRHMAHQTSYNLGSTYPHEEEHDLGDADSMTHLIDLVMGIFQSHGQPHSFFDEFLGGPDYFLSQLLDRRHDPITEDVSSPLPNPDLATIGRLLEGANLMRYLKEGRTGHEKIADSPYDNIGDRYALYYHDEDGIYPGTEGESDGLLHGLEPDTGRGDSVPQRFNEFKASPEATPIENLLIHPHERVSHGNRGIGSVKELRELLAGHPSAPESLDSVFHQQRLSAIIADLANRKGWDKERERTELSRATGAIAPAETDRVDEWGKWVPHGGMENYDIYPVLDPDSDSTWTTGRFGRPSHAEGPLARPSPLLEADDEENWDSNFNDNFFKYLITSRAYRLGSKRLQQGRSSVDMGQGLVGDMGLGGGSEAEEDSEEGSGYLLAPEPFSLMSRHIERLRDLALTFSEDSIARKRVEEAIRKQQEMQFQVAYSNQGAFDDSDAQIGRVNYAHMFLRMMGDTLHHTGLVAQALKKHFISQDQNNAGLFGPDPQGYANHMELLHFANSLLHAPDQSWRKALGTEMAKLGDEPLSNQISEPHTVSSYISPVVREGVYNLEAGQFESAEADGIEHERMTGAFKGAEIPKGTAIARHYIENGHGIGGADVHARARRALAILDLYNSPEDFMGDLDNIYSRGSRGRTVTGPEIQRGKSDSVDSIRFAGTANQTRDDFSALMSVLGNMDTDSRKTTRAISVRDNEPLGDWGAGFNQSTSMGKAARGRRMANATRSISRLLHPYSWDYEGSSGKLSLSETDKPKTVPFGGKEGLAPLSLWSSGALKRRGGSVTRASINPTYTGGLPTMTATHGVPGEDRARIHVAPNIANHLFGESLGYEGDVLHSPEAADYYETGNQRTAAQRELSTVPPNETMGDSGIMARGFDLELDVLTNEDLIHKKDEGDPVPIKPMHRIFALDDLEHLRGFSDDWVVSSWPEGERVIVHKKGKKLVITNSGGKKVAIPNKVRKDIRKAYDADFIVDAIWDDECLHIVDVIQVADEKVWDDRTKDRNRLLRAKFEATDNVSIPAPINTKRTDSEGLQRAYDDLMKEKGVKQILLRDAEATYMRGESRHPKWVLWRPDKTIDVRVVCSSGAQHCLGVGPIDEEMARSIGNRSQEYEGEHYMDVGSLYSTKVEEGDYITVAVSSTSVTSRKKTDIYQVNAPRYIGPSESHATDSIDTLRILSPATERNIPHKVRVKKGNVLISFPLGDVVYETESIGHGFIIKSVDAPSDYLGRIAESQRDYWAPLAAVLLRSESEKMKEKDEKEAVVPEPPANHDKKPKKVLKPSERLLKDPELAKSIVVSLHKVEELLKEKITWTGPKGLGIDHGSPIESPSGPTENTEGYNLPDHDPGHRQEKHGACWCGAEKGQTCEQGRAHKMEDCPISHPPRDESKDPKHIRFSHSSREDSSV